MLEPLQSVGEFPVVDGRIQKKADNLLLLADRGF